MTEYIPTWPRLGVAPECIDRNNCGQLAQKGFLNNGRKSGGVVAQDIVQLNMCSERFVKFNGCFVDDSNAPIVLQSSAVRFFDIDHGADKDMGPEVFQFKCPGGTFSLYGYEHDEEGETEFLVHMNTEAKALERAASGETTVNGLPVHVYDCPEHDWVTLWSSRSGRGKDNPISSIILEDPINGATQERSMVQIDMYNINEFEVAFGVLDQEYQEGYAITKKTWNKKKKKWVNVKDADGNNVLTGEIGKADPVKLKRLQDGLALSHANYPEQVRHE